MEEGLQRLINLSLTILEIVILFGTVVFLDKIFKEKGLIAWAAIASVWANIEVSKIVVILGIETTLGNVMFASIFLTNDILSEKYGEKIAKQSVYISLTAVLVYLISSQLSLLYIPSDNDVVHECMQNLFMFAPRICLSSVLMFFVSNMISVKLFSFLKKKMNSKKMWVRNNISTILCNCGENFAFSLLAFGGVYEWGVVLEIAISTSLIELVIAICDTPFLYLSKMGGD